MNIFNIGDIIIPIEGIKGNIWIILNVITPAVDSTSYYVLQNLEEEDEIEVLYCNHIEKYYEKANE